MVHGGRLCLIFTTLMYHNTGVLYSHFLSHTNSLVFITIPITVSFLVSLGFPLFALGFCFGTHPQFFSKNAIFFFNIFGTHPFFPKIAYFLFFPKPPTHPQHRISSLFLHLPHSSHNSHNSFLNSDTVCC